MALLASVTVVSCIPQRSIDVPLPSVPPRLVVESYAEAGSILRVSVSQTSPYFQTIPTDTAGLIRFVQQQLITGDSALAILVRFAPDGTTELERDTLTYSPFGTPGNVYPFGEFRSRNPIPADYSQVLALQVQDLRRASAIPVENRIVVATTQLIQPVPIDSIRVEKNPRGKEEYSVRVRWRDPDLSTTNYFRVTITNGNPDSTTSINLRDELLTSEVIGFATTYYFAPGDTVDVRLYHVPKVYHDFRRSVDGATAANSNPFSEPTRIFTNWSNGGYGIFSGVAGSRQQVVIPR